MKRWLVIASLIVLFILLSGYDMLYLDNPNKNNKTKTIMNDPILSKIGYTPPTINTSSPGLSDPAYTGTMPSFSFTPPTIDLSSQGLSTSGSGTAGGGSTNYVEPDPYARWGGGTAGQATFNNLVQGFADQKQNVFNSSNDAAANAGLTLKNSILDYVDQLRAGQQGIDNKAVQNELAKRQGTTGVLGMVSRGIRSGGVTLANKNAAGSSAAEAIARAYGDIGHRQLAGIGNQYAQGQDQVLQDQGNLDIQRASGARKLQDTKTQDVNSIVDAARAKLADLSAQMANASLPDRIAIEQETQNVKNQVLSQLQQYDQLLAEQAGGVQAQTEDQRRAKANQLYQAGTPVDNPFQFSSQVPAQFQNSGPFAGELPLFSLPSSKKNQLA